VDRYTLVATKVAPAGMAQGRVPDFAGAIPPNHGTDPGRRWAGDPYTTGPMTDPAEAFAHFSGGEGVEAWLDKQDDGTLVGWVLDGQDVWRYTDPNTWASDVDAAQMSRLDTPSLDEAVNDALNPAPQADDTQIPSNQAASDFGPDTPDEENPFLADNSETLDAAAADANDEAASAQANLPADSPTPQDPNIDPTAAPDTEPDPTTALAAEEADPNEPEPDADPDDEDKKKGNPFGKTEKKHLPGQHDQREHGNWAHGIHVDHTHAPDGTAIRLPTTGGSSGPKAPEPAAPAPAKPKAPTRAPAKASLSRDALENLSVAALEGIWASGEGLYDQDTLSHVAMLLDEKNPLDGDQLPDDPAGELGAFAGVIPDHYVQWVARNSPHAPQAKNRSKREQIEEAYQNYIDAQYQQAAAWTKGVLWSKQGQSWARQHGKDEMSLFNGSVTRPQIKKYASEELLRYFAEHPRMTFQQFADEFYPSYAKATAHLKGAYLSEHG
jgi:hypothetical protein